MAKEEKQKEAPADEADKDEAEAEATPVKAGGAKKKILIIAIAGVLLAVLGVGGTFVAMGMMSKDPQTSVKDKKKKKTDTKDETQQAKGDKEGETDADEEQAKDGEGDAPTKEDEADATAKEGEEEKEGEEGDGVPAKPALYMEFDQPFIVNFVDEGSVRYLQIGVAVMGREPTMPATVKTHMPYIRNNLVMMFSNQSREAILSREGKEKIRLDAQAEVQKILKQQTGQRTIEALYLTNFVVQ
jgi:flagellar FliL protein